MKAIDLTEVPRSGLSSNSFSSGLYAEWRARMGGAHTLAERSAQLPLREQLLRLIWHYQRVRRDHLETTDGQPVRVLHPGFWNRESGPDFKGAAIQFGNGSAQYGDVEVDLLPQGWQVHGHAQNPAYRDVILHVVWHSTEPSPFLPTLALKSRLDSPLEELELWLRQDLGDDVASLKGRCSESLRHVQSDDLIALLEQASLARLQTKGCHLQARARQVGWEKSLWEGLFGALGYKNNVWPMQRISEMLPALTGGGESTASILTLQARLLGVSGLLPTQVPTFAETTAYLRSVWDVWWRDREQFAELTLSRSLWRLHGLRPANSPHRRLALAAHWLAQTSLPASLERWFANTKPNRKLRTSLMQVLQGTDDAFWSRHWTLQSGPTRHFQPLIGHARVTDLAVNIILPWFWIRAVVGHNQPLQQQAENCYLAWPAAQDNASLRLARQRLFGRSDPGLIHTAARQQGLLQIVRDFCDYSNALCENCPFPGLVSNGGIG